MTVEIGDIMKALPHRYPFLLVDRIVAVERGERVVGIKNVTINEPFFQGHFPGNPVMPGVLVLEAMAQVGAVMFLEQMNDFNDKYLYLAGIDDVRFRRPVIPGDQLKMELTVLSLRSRSCKVRGTATVDGNLVAEAKLFCVLVERAQAGPV